jgi:hypothetical protein
MVQEKLLQQVLKLGNHLQQQRYLLPSSPDRSETHAGVEFHGQPKPSGNIFAQNDLKGSV